MDSSDGGGVEVGDGRGGGGRVIGEENVGDEFEGLVEVVEDDEGVLEHKDRLRDLEGGGERSSGFGFEVMDAVVGDHADSSS